MKIGGGEELLLSVGRGVESDDAVHGVFRGGEVVPTQKPSDQIDASRFVLVSAASDDNQIGRFAAIGVLGDVAGMTWSVDQQDRMVLRIPADDRVRTFDVVRTVGDGTGQLTDFHASLGSKRRHLKNVSPRSLTQGGPLLWPDVISTVGYTGLEEGGYVLDTLTLPESTPWNTWFRTSALDFYPDGRMALATYGGDIWIVSGIDDDLINLRWKRYAGWSVRALRCENFR